MCVFLSSDPIRSLLHTHTHTHTHILTGRVAPRSTHPSVSRGTQPPTHRKEGSSHVFAGGRGGPDRCPPQRPHPARYQCHPERRGGPQAPPQGCQVGPGARRGAQGEGNSGKKKRLDDTKQSHKARGITTYWMEPSLAGCGNHNLNEYESPLVPSFLLGFAP